TSDSPGPIGPISEGRNLVTEQLDATAGRTAGGSLSTMRLAELQALAGEMGLKGTGRMRKSDLVAAIREARGGASTTAPRTNGRSGTAAATPATSESPAPATEPAAPAAEEPAAATEAHSRRGRSRRASTAAGAPSPAEQPEGTNGSAPDDRTAPAARTDATESGRDGAEGADRTERGGRAERAGPRPAPTEGIGRA